MISLPGIGSLIVGALLTCGYALGQLAGPMLSALFSWWSGRLEPSLLASMLALAVAGLLAWRKP